MCARKNRTPQRSCEVHVRTAVLLVDPEASGMSGIAKTAKDVSVTRARLARRCEPLLVGQFPFLVGVHLSVSGSPLPASGFFRFWFLVHVPASWGSSLLRWFLCLLVPGLGGFLPSPVVLLSLHF